MGKTVNCSIRIYINKIENRIADKIQRASKTSSKNNSDTNEEKILREKGASIKFLVQSQHIYQSALLGNLLAK